MKTDEFKLLVEVHGFTYELVPTDPENNLSLFEAEEILEINEDMYKDVYFLIEKE
jgi:hypothetical protein